VCLLDEIDKANNCGEKQGFTGALYGLLEKKNAKLFQDEYVGISMDASRINWFATSNDMSAIDEPIRDRFEVISVSAPSKRHLMQIIPHLFRSIILEMNLEHAFATDMNRDVVRKIISQNNASIRRIQSSIKSGLANAAVRVDREGEEVSLLPIDISESHAVEAKQKIGFIH